MWVFIFAIPFWLMGSIVKSQLLPGLPFAALTAICPMLAALILTYRDNGIEGMKKLLKRSFDFKRVSIKAWYLPTLALMPIVSVLSFYFLRLSGVDVPAPMISPTSVLILCLVFFIGALGEELGWSGYVIDRMQNRFGALLASILLGLIWTIFHYIALGQAHRSLEWIAWWSLGTMTTRILIVWLYNNTRKSVFIASLFHMSINVCWQLFPINGSYYDPSIAGLILLSVTIIAVIFSNPRTLMKRRTRN